MATLTANHCHAVRTFDVEKVYPASEARGEAFPTRHVERWAIRSDGKVLSQIVFTEEIGAEPRWYCRCSKGKCGTCVDGKTTRLVHSSGYAIRGGLQATDREGRIEGLRAALLRRGYTIVSER